MFIRAIYVCLFGRFKLCGFLLLGKMFYVTQFLYLNWLVLEDIFFCGLFFFVWCFYFLQLYRIVKIDHWFLILVADKINDLNLFLFSFTINYTDRIVNFIN